jgi:hypothetical protein
MAGNCNVACAEGHLSLAKEGARVDPETLLLVPIPQLDSLPLSQWIGAKRKRLHQGDLTPPRTRNSQPPTSCGQPGSKALQIVCFSLVTLTRLLY